MATLGAQFPTLSDIAKEMDPDGKPARIIRILNQSNRILDDMPFYEGNLPEGHQVTQDTALPSASVRQINQGTVSTKGTAGQFVEQAAMYDIWSKADARIPEKFGGNESAWRVSNGRRFLEGMSQTVAAAILYGNPATTPGEFRGLTTRCNSLSGVNSQNVIDGGGVQSDNGSIILVGWGPDSVHGFYPKGSQAGMRHEDWGKQLDQNAATASASSGGLMEVFVDHWFWDIGVVVADWRYLVRAPNIDLSALRILTGDADLTDLMSQMVECLPSLENIKPVFYMPRAFRTHLRRQRRADIVSGGGLTWENIDGKRVDFFDGIKIEALDQMSLAETQVT